ncbi:MAG: hypothetical protein V3U75_11480 [Methylococcaceae bacterium]
MSEIDGSEFTLIADLVLLAMGLVHVCHTTESTLRHISRSNQGQVQLKLERVARPRERDQA